MTKLTFISRNFVNVPKTGKINGSGCYVVNANNLTTYHAPQNKELLDQYDSSISGDYEFVIQRIL